MPGLSPVASRPATSENRSGIWTDAGRLCCLQNQSEGKDLMPPNRKSTKRIKDEIARLEQQLKQAEVREAERLGMLAVKAGLHEIDASEGAITAAFQEVSARFRQTQKPSAQTA
jgi:hypothetical protein